MKKLLATFVSACLLVGTLPATVMADDFQTSITGGQDHEITTLKFNQSSYTIPIDGSIDFADEVTAYVGTTKIVQNPNLDFSFENNSTLAFVAYGSELTAIETSGSGVMTVTANSGTVVAKVTVNATSNTTTNATGFTLDQSIYTVPVGVEAEDFYLTITPTPTTATFTQAQEQEIFATLSSAFLDMGATLSATTIQDGNKYTLLLTAASLSNITADQWNATSAETGKLSLEFYYPNSNDSSSTSRIVKTFSVKSAEAVPAVTIGVAASTLSLKVGQTVNLDTYFKYGPSSSNVKKEIVMYTTYASDAEYFNDYAVLNSSHDLLGVAVGTVKVVAYLSNEPSQTASITVNVTATDASTSGTTSGTTSDTTSSTTSDSTTDSSTSDDYSDISLSTEFFAVNIPFIASLSNVASTDSVTWAISDTSVAEASAYEGKNIAITPKKLGSFTLTAYMNGQKIATTTVNVTYGTTDSADDEVTVTPPSTSTNPPTGDSWFKGLFF